VEQILNDFKSCLTLSIYADILFSKGPLNS